MRVAMDVALAEAHRNAPSDRWTAKATGILARVTRARAKLNKRQSV